MDPVSVGQAIRALRNQKQVGLRELCRIAELSPATLSAIESGQSSPTLATLHRILRVLGTDFATFFASNNSSSDGIAFPAETMTAVTDGRRQCVFTFPRRQNIKFAMARETLPPDEPEVEWEVHDCDLGAVILDGGPMLLETDDGRRWTLQAGDAFYMPAGVRHRGRNIGDRELRLVTTYDPPRY